MVDRERSAPRWVHADRPIRQLPAHPMHPLPVVRPLVRRLRQWPPHQPIAAVLVLAQLAVLRAAALVAGSIMLALPALALALAVQPPEQRLVVRSWRRQHRQRQLASNSCASSSRLSSGA